MDVSIASAASPAHTHPSRKESAKGWAARSAALRFVEAARSDAPFLDGCAWAGEAADALETSIKSMKHAHVCISLEIHEE